MRCAPSAQYTQYSTYLAAGLDPATDLVHEQLVVLHVLEHLDRDHPIRAAYATSRVMSCCSGISGRKEEWVSENETNGSRVGARVV